MGQVSYYYQSNKINFVRNNHINHMNQTSVRKQRVYQDYQVHPQSCCRQVLNALSQTPDIQNQLIQKKNSLRLSGEKGIKLVKHFKSYQALPQVKLSLVNRKKSDDRRSLLTTQKSIKSPNPVFQNEYTTLSQSKGFVLNQKCIDYKNQKILQRSKISQRSYENPINLQTPLKLKKQDETPTMQNTPRTVNCSDYYEDQSKIQISSINHQSQNKQQQFSEINQKSKINSDRSLFFDLKPIQNKKTLSRVYQECYGEKIVTVQSQESGNNNSMEFSIAESFQF